MKRLSATLFSALLVLAGVSLGATSSYALGNCGFNGHRNYYGRCVFGGQNQNYCLRRTGHPAVRMPNGTYRCF